MATITLTVTATDLEQKILLNDLLDIDDWVQAAFAGKKNNCWKRFHSDWSNRLLNDESFLKTAKTKLNNVEYRMLGIGEKPRQKRIKRKNKTVTLDKWL